MNTQVKRLLAIGCCIAFSVLATTSRAQQLEEVNYLLPAPPTASGFIPWMVAQERGYYAEEGLKIVFSSAKGGMDVAKQVGAGNAPIGGAIGDTAIVARAQGIPIKVVALIGGKPYHHLQVIADSGVSDIRGLKGKTVTVMSYQDTSYITLLGILAAAGLTKEDVDIQAAGPVGVWQNPVAGKGVAFIGPMTWAVQAGLAGKKVTTIQSEQYFPSMAQAIVASDEIISKRPELIGKLVHATLRGLQDVMNDPDGTAVDFIKQSPLYEGRDAEVEAFNRESKKYTYAGMQRLGEVDPKLLAALQDFYVKENIVAQPVPVEDLYTNQFIR